MMQNFVTTCLLMLVMLPAMASADEKQCPLEPRSSVSEPSPAPPAAPVLGYLLITDLDEMADPVVSLKLLFEDDMQVARPDAISTEALLAAGSGIVILLADTSAATKLLEPLLQYVTRGGNAVIDTAAYAAMHGLQAEKTAARHVRIVNQSGVTAGLGAGDRLVLHGQGQLQVLVEDVAKRQGIRVLGVAGADDAPALIEHEIGKGRMVVMDLQTPAEPYIWDSGSFHKYLFLTNTIGNAVRFGSLLQIKPTYGELVKQMQQLDAEFASITSRNEGPASDGQDIFSLSFGNPDAPGVLILGSVHGNEWENSPALVLFMRRLAENHAAMGVDPNTVHVKVVPVLSTFGYDNVSRLNANGVNLNRNGDVEWQAYTAADTNGDGVYGPGDQDWKGTGPLSEPETQALIKICKANNFTAVLDLHSNPSGTRYNKLINDRSVITGSLDKAKALSEQYNRQVRGRYILRQQHEKEVRPVSNELVFQGRPGPTLIASTFMTRDRYCLLVELPGGIWTKDARQSTYGTIMCNDLVSEMCLAFIKTIAAKAD